MAEHPVPSTPYKDSKPLCNGEHSEAFISEIIAMAWADDVSFDKIKQDRGIAEAEVIRIMRGNLKANSFKLWRKRVTGRQSKHEKRAKLLQQSCE